MFTLKHYINIISLAVQGVIGGLFILKYSGIYLGNSLLFTAAYLILYCSILYLIIRYEKIIFPGFMRKINIFLTAVICLGIILIIIFIPRIGEIGRLPAIDDWIRRLFAGLFPYNSPHTPSGFPFLFFMNMPFYFIGNAGLFIAAGLVLFLFVLNKYSNNPRELFFRILVLLLVPVIYYDIFVRSELFVNTALILFLFIFSEKYLDPQKVDMSFILFAVLFGLLLSTRSVAGLVYIIYLLFSFKTNLLKLILFSIITLVVFVSLLLPFYYWDPVSFNNNGPFAIQSFLAYIPVWIIAGLFLFSLLAGWMSADLQEVFFTSGIVLFSAVFISMILKIKDYGFLQSFEGDVFDLSYYAFCLPFLIMALKDYKVDRYLGKIESPL